MYCTYIVNDQLFPYTWIILDLHLLSVSLMLCSFTTTSLLRLLLHIFQFWFRYGWNVSDWYGCNILHKLRFGIEDSLITLWSLFYGFVYGYSFSRCIMNFCYCIWLFETLIWLQIGTYCSKFHSASRFSASIVISVVLPLIDYYRIQNI